MAFPSENRITAMQNVKIRSLKYNFIMNLLLTGSTIFFPLITFPFVSRALLADIYGLCNWAISVVGWFSAIALLGVGQYGIREVARYRDDPEKLTRFTLQMLAFTLLSTLLCYVAFFMMLFNVEEFSQNYHLLLINSIAILCNTLGVAWFFQGIEQYSYITIRGVIIRAVCFIGVVLLVHTPDDYLIYALLFAGSMALANLINFFYMLYLLLKELGEAESQTPIKHFTTILKSITLSSLLPHVKPMFIFFLTASSATMYGLIATTLLGFLSTFDEVGYYTAAINVTAAVTGVMSALSSVLMPRATHMLANNNIIEYKQLLKKCIYLVLVVSILCCVSLAFVATPLLSWYAGEGYEPAGIMLSITCLSSIPAALSLIFFNSVLAPLNLERYSAYAYTVATLLNLACNILLIPHLGGVGAAYATLITESFLLVSGFFFARKYLWGNSLV